MDGMPLVRNDPQALRFEINRAALVDPAVLERERARIFDRCWIYVGHESDVRAPGDFRTRTVCGRPVIFCRDSAGAVRVFLNTCRHRGAMVCREREGNAQRYTCFYHGWTYDRDGRLYAVPGQSAYPPCFSKDDYSLGEPAKVAAYGGFVFVSFDAAVEPVESYLGAAKEYIDLVLDQSPSRRLEVIHGTQEYDIKANWKLLVENSF
ncbi:MAG TPA: aromatic ring-hydroxylating dioxygenase subunit alpha, partial [Gammaproteobacteria bacterium]|nr:aromatic ring-hydroxylating dioxygenase subunit alpha [Gammaproteobacteria bacterium]